MRRDNRGISRIVEFVIMFTVFIVIVTAFYSLANIWLRPPIVNYAQEEAMRISEVLINNPGCMDNNNSKTNWEDYPAYYKGAPNIDTNMTSLGFAKNKNSYGVLSMSKILGMGKITYPKARTLLGLSPGQNFNITIESINNTKIIGNETKICWGADYTSAKNVGMYKRIVAVYNPFDNNYTAAKLIVRLFDGGFCNESIVINEIMYDPPMIDEDSHEWVELYNPTSLAINVSRWSIHNVNPTETGWQLLQEVIATGEEWENVSSRGAIIPADGYAIISQSILTVSANFTFGPDAIWLTQRTPDGSPPSGIGGFGLINTGDTIILKDKYHDIVDSVTYSSGWGDDKNGDVHHANNERESIEKINPLGPNDGTNWEESRTGGKNGTLGRRNNISIVKTGLISVGPDRWKDYLGVELPYNLTIMNNGNVNDTINIIISNESYCSVNITYFNGTGWTNLSDSDSDGFLDVNLSAINLCNNVSEIYAKIRVNLTINTTGISNTYVITMVTVKSSEHAGEYDTTTLLAKVA